MRICIEKLTGKILEAQSGDAKKGALIANAINAGFSNVDIEEKVVSSEEYQALIDSQITPEQKEKREQSALKFAGVKFEGVLCSAEAEDMWGLSSIKEFISAGNSTPFVFKNGNTLLLTPDNLAAFQAVWIPFRLGFFK
tara:strand:+ start:323 stop:739 length:417 start_codon:yes stop_codon:yes gene_type:complete